MTVEGGVIVTECPRCHQISNHNAYCQNCQLQISYSINSSNSNSSDMNEKRKASAHHSKQWPIKKMIPIGIIGFIIILLIILFLLLKNYNSPEAQAQILINAIDKNDTSRLSNILSSKDNKVGPNEADTYIQFIKSEIGMASFERKVNKTVANLEQETAIAAYVKTANNQNVLRISKNGRRYLIFNNLGFQAPTKQAEVKPNVRSKYEFNSDGYQKKIIADQNQAVSLGNFIPGKYSIEVVKTTDRGTYHGHLKFNTSESKSNVVKVTEDFEQATIQANLKNTEGLEDKSIKVVINDEKLDYGKNKNYGPFPLSRDLNVYAVGQTNGKTFKTDTQVIKKDDIQSKNNVKLTFDDKAIERFNKSQEKDVVNQLSDFIKDYIGALGNASKHKDYSQVANYLNGQNHKFITLKQDIEREKNLDFKNPEVINVQESDGLYYVTVEKEANQHRIVRGQYTVRGEADKDQFKIVDYDGE
ncbi:teicoplanin resistance protein VanZ [Staphylococcus felis]|nr:teicoplanin resistance protein VanZ [Staphylococcus felis]